MSMEDCRSSQRFLCRANQLENFCKGATVDLLVSGSSDQITRPVALVDDRKEDDVVRMSEIGFCRSRKGPLSSRQLHQLLSKPRYNTDKITSTMPGGSRDGEDPNEPDADRRLIYITDLNPFSVLALLDTVSYHQAYSLRDFIYGHLTYSASLGVTIPLTGVKRFALEVHLPYYAWRNGNSYVKDSRQMADGRPLRRGQRLDFLDMTPSGAECASSNDYIYEAQMSLLVAGLDDHSWVGYFFNDTYHNGTNNEESVVNYNDQELMDPLSGGMLTANPPIWDPRSYFLRIFEIRLEQVKHEWINNISMIQKKTSSYTQDYHVFKSIYLSPDSRNRGERLTRFHDWTGSTTRLLMDLKQALSRTVCAWDLFQRGDIKYFENVDPPKGFPTPPLCLMAITKHVEEMRDQLNALDYQEKVCTNIFRELESCLSLENRDTGEIQLRTGEIQLRTGENVKVITTLALLVSPPAVSAAIFSMQPGVLPWEPSLIGWFVTTIILAFIVVLVSRFLLSRSLRRTDHALQGIAARPLSATRRCWPCRLWHQPYRFWRSPVGLAIPPSSSEGINYDNDGTELADFENRVDAASLV
ncbi:hypothetical protein F5B20DRAFT_585074 [Whalleya microplaca]|nr:hypothetical protein F5B20DRAFT_585074 [Whalleya microplaca]